MNDYTKHPNEEDLFAFLDGELDPGARRAVEAHLLGCVTCSAQLKAWGALFAEVADLPEVAFDHDLAPSVLRALRTPLVDEARTQRFLPAAVLFQFAAAVAILVFAVPAVSEMPQVESWLADTLVQVNHLFTSLDPGTMLTPLNAVQTEIEQQLQQLFAEPDAILSALAALVPLAVSSSLLWLVGNAILIRKYAPKQISTGSPGLNNSQY